MAVDARYIRKRYAPELHKAIPILEDVTRYPLEQVRALVLMNEMVYRSRDEAELEYNIESFIKFRDAVRLKPDAPERIYLWPEGKIPALTDYSENPDFIWYHDPDFRPYFLEALVAEDRPPTGAVVIIGGGQQGPGTIYDYQICLDFNKKGYQCFILHCRPNSNPWDAKECGADVARCLRMIRANASKYRISPDRVAVAGMSNGGIAGECCIRYFSGKQTVADHFPNYTPDALDELPGCQNVFICIYGAQHKGTDFDYSKVVYPPTFYATGLEDKRGIENLYAVLEAHFKIGTRLEIHTFAGYPHGPAGIFILDGKGRPEFDLWLDRADVFMRDTYENYQN